MVKDVADLPWLMLVTGASNFDRLSLQCSFEVPQLQQQLLLLKAWHKNAFKVPAKAQAATD
jgi:hypothetical protein